MTCGGIKINLSLSQLHALWADVTDGVNGNAQLYFTTKCDSKKTKKQDLTKLN